MPIQQKPTPLRHADGRGETDVPAGLLDGFRAGERWAFDAVYRRYVMLVSRVVRAALRRSGWARVGGQEKRGGYGRGDLPDLVQEVFARLFSPAARRRFEGHDLKPYLAGIATYVVLEFGRARDRYVLTDFDLIDTRVTACGAAVDGDRDSDGVGDRATSKLVAWYVGGLDPNLRAVHDLLYVRGLSQRAAAEALGVGRQTVRTLESRLRGGLRRLLETERAATEPNETVPDRGKDLSA
jgi:RNA polymerase sigma-70 factor (ECF subfamily)